MFICCCGKVFNAPLHSDGHLFLFHYSGFRLSRHSVSSFGLLVSSAMVLLREHLPQCASATGSLHLLLQASSLEGWTDIFVSAWWAALEAVPARLSSAPNCNTLLPHWCPSNREVNAVAPQGTAMALRHRLLDISLKCCSTTWNSVIVQVLNWG